MIDKKTIDDHVPERLYLWGFEELKQMLYMAHCKNCRTDYSMTRREFAHNAIELAKPIENEYVTDIKLCGKVFLANVVDGQHGEYTGKCIPIKLTDYEPSQYIYNGSKEENVGNALWRLK